MTHLSSLLVCSVVAATLVTSALGQTQTASEQTEPAGSTVGTVVSVSRQTMTLRTGDNQFQLFVFNNNMEDQGQRNAALLMRLLAQRTA